MSDIAIPNRETAPRRLPGLLDVVDKVLSQTSGVGDAGPAVWTDLLCQRIELLRGTQPACRTQLTFVDHVRDSNPCKGYSG
jgi:hypothetical protein